MKTIFGKLLEDLNANGTLPEAPMSVITAKNGVGGIEKVDTGFNVSFNTDDAKRAEDLSNEIEKELEQYNLNVERVFDSGSTPDDKGTEIPTSKKITGLKLTLK